MPYAVVTTYTGEDGPVLGFTASEVFSRKAEARQAWSFIVQKGLPLLWKKMRELGKEPRTVEGSSRPLPWFYLAKGEEGAFPPGGGAVLKANLKSWTDMDSKRHEGGRARR